jgi:hypothetical protein
MNPVPGRDLSEETPLADEEDVLLTVTPPGE